jgi:hypothetical protein
MPKASNEPDGREVREPSPNPYSPILNSGRTGSTRKEHYDPIVLKICAEAINDVYLSVARGTIQATLDAARHRVLQRELGEGNDMPHAQVTLRLPTRWLIRRLINEIPAFDRHAARYRFLQTRHAGGR